MSNYPWFNFFLDNFLGEVKPKKLKLINIVNRNVYLYTLLFNFRDFRLIFTKRWRKIMDNLLVMCFLVFNINISKEVQINYLDTKNTFRKFILRNSRKTSGKFQGINSRESSCNIFTWVLEYSTNVLVVSGNLGISIGYLQDI